MFGTGAAPEPWVLTALGGNQRFKTLRIWITNTVEDQVWQNGELNTDSFDFLNNTEAWFRVKIEGRLLDDDDDEEEDDLDRDDADEEADKSAGDKMETETAAESKAKEIEAKKPPRPRFSHFFKAMTVEFDRTKMRNGADQNVEWKKPDRIPSSPNPPAAADFDELTFKRNGDENMKITINLFRDETPERFELSPELSDIVDLTAATRSEVSLALWDYIKLMGLQEDEEKRHFRCDELLRKVCTHARPEGVQQAANDARTDRPERSRPDPRAAKLHHSPLAAFGPNQAPIHCSR